jgi:2'-5' RNA ligase
VSDATGCPRLFLAVWPPDDVISELRTLRRKNQRGVRFVDPERWHITLRFLGNTDPDVVIDALDGADLPATTARLGPAVDVFWERVLAVPVAGLDELAEITIDRTRRIGEPPRRGPFRGHLTLARLHRGAQLPPAIGSRVEMSFEVDEVSLVWSRLHPNGSRYETIHTWPVD